VGYQSRWALEIRVVDYGDIPLVIGTPIAQVVFHTATPTASSYMGQDRYQQDDQGAVRFIPKNLKVTR
jgi:deoxycytidine triphosphate deaminase